LALSVQNLEALNVLHLFFLLTLTHLINILQKKVDTGFTIFESIPPDEFHHLSRHYQNSSKSWRNFSENELNEPLALNKEVQQDPRYGHVFLYHPNGRQSLEKNIFLPKEVEIAHVLVNEFYIPPHALYRKIFFFSFFVFRFFWPFF
jgi:hypothetical protein